VEPFAKRIAVPDWRRICCPVDFSEPSRAALAEAAELARRSGAWLALIHVEAHSPDPSAEAPFAPPPRIERGEPGASAQLEALTAEAERLRGAPVHAELLAGTPAPEIARFARENGCDLIVLGAHHRRGLSRMLHASVAEHLVRGGPCDVLVIQRGG
jgi:nucleotide-binding universal stress UspA family protein